MREGHIAASETRLAQARAVARVYAAYPDVDAVIVGGSVARGWADRWSDVELGIIWTTLPGERALEDLAGRAGGERRILGTLLGLNRVYPPVPETKWLIRVAAELPVAPPNLAHRL
jgi:hypothetical protein